MKDRKMSIFICEYCGKEFLKRSDLKPRYCSSACCGKAKSEKERKYIVCPICGVTFRKKRSTNVYCSNKCANIARKKSVFVECDNCGKQIEKPQCHIKEHNFCSTECRNEWYAKHAVGENASRWNGGIYHTSEGYLFLRQDDGSYKAEHRIVMEKELGRELTSDEIVHHIDENKTNNSIDNLIVLTRAEHAKIHRKSK